MSSKKQGETVTLFAEFRLPADPPTTGMLVSPNEVVVQVMRPDGYKFDARLSVSGSYGQVSMAGQGIYTYRINLSQAGRYTYRFTAKGTYSGTTGDATILVDPSDFAPV